MMVGITKSRDAYLAAVAKHPELQNFLVNDDVTIWNTIRDLPENQRDPLIGMWAASRATADVQGWSDAYRKIKSLSHGVVGGTFVGLFGNNVKAAISSLAYTMNDNWGAPYRAALAYNRAIDSALAIDEGKLKTIGNFTGIGSQIALPLLSLSGTAASTAATTTQAIGFTALQGPVYLVPLATTRLGNMVRFGGADAISYAAANCAISDCNHYKTVDGAVDGGFYGLLIGGVMPRNLRPILPTVHLKTMSEALDDVAHLAVAAPPKQVAPSTSK